MRVVSRSDGENVKKMAVPYATLLACVWCRIVLRTSWVPGMFLVLASTLASVFLAASLRPGTCRSLVTSPLTALSSPVMSLYFPLRRWVMSSLHPCPISSLVISRPPPSWSPVHIHVRVGLQVDAGAEVEVPHGEAKVPITAELAFHSPAHGRGPVLVEGHIGCVGVASLAARPGPF